MDIINADPALTMYVLRVAASAAKRPATPIVSLQHAVAWLGFDEVANIAFTLALQGKMLDVKGQQRPEPTRAELQYPVAEQRVTNRPRVIYRPRDTGSAGRRAPQKGVLSMRASLHYRAFNEKRHIGEPSARRAHVFGQSSSGGADLSVGEVLFR
jgi:hypothetical protein